MRKSRETKLIEGIILTLWIILIIGIAADAAFSQTAKAVAINTVKIETTKGHVVAVNSGYDEIMVKYAGKAREITLPGLEEAGETAAAQFASLIVMSYDAGTGSNYRDAWRRFKVECGCDKQDPKINKEYFDNAWYVRKMLLKILPAEVLDELGQRLMSVGTNGALVVRK